MPSLSVPLFLHIQEHPFRKSLLNDTAQASPLFPELEGSESLVIYRAVHVDGHWADLAFMLVLVTLDLM